MTKDINNEEEKDFPGYPHYPASEDIMNVEGDIRVNADVENLSRSNLTSSAPADRSVEVETKKEEVLADVDADDLNLEPNDADVTADDLIALEGTEADPAKVDMLEGEDDLDIPGAEEDDANEEIGEEDEENNYYSVGGDAHDD